MISTDTIVYRPGFARRLAVAVLVIAVIGLGSSLLTDFAASLRFVPVIALVVAAIWAAYFFPSVTISPAGVTIRNITRTIELPWPAIQRIETKYALTLYTAYGSYSAWAAPAPGRAEIARAGNAKVYREHSAGLPQSTVVGGTIAGGDLLNSSSGQAALLVRQRWEELREAGYLDNARLERAKPKITWHWPLLALLAALAVASVLVALF
jgi:hypothetical protein